MKAIFTTVVIALGIWLLGKQPATLGQVPSTPTSTLQLSRDLAPFPNFFQEGVHQREEQIQQLIKRQEASPEPPLKNNVIPQAELELLPQIQPRDFLTPNQSQTE